MTRIFEAYKKRASGQPDFAFDLASLGEIRLFPPPSSGQQAELSQLADMILKFKPPDRGLVLCFASTVAGEGASYVSYNTARFLAYVLHRRVAWVDVNFKTPQRKLVGQPGITFAELLRNPASLTELPTGGNLTLVPGGANLGSRAAQVSSQPSQQLLRGFAELFEFTILDCPPILQAVETGQLAAAADGLIAVVESKRLKREVIRHGLDSLASRRVKVLGAVLNRREYELPRIIYDRL